MGIMHRDIRPANMLQLSSKPAQAAICDFGKAIEAESSKYTAIGPVHTVAPEVWDIAYQGAYTRSIDIWAFGYAIAEILRCPGAYNCGNPAITRERHETILEALRIHARQDPEDDDLVDLAIWMLAWQPKLRPTAAEALKHKCWAPIRTYSSPSTQSSFGLGPVIEYLAQERDSKRRKLDP
jgi:serine/threonine protein kinase